jgi:site-specific recombinase XerD
MQALVLGDGSVEMRRASSLVELWLAGRAQHTALAYRSDLLRFCEFAKLEVERLNQIEDVIAFNAAAKWLESLNASTATLNRKASSLRSFYDFLVSVGMSRRNPLVAIKTPKVHNKKKDVITRGEIDAMLARCDRTKQVGRRNYAMLLMMAELGLRRHEVVTLTHGNLKTADGRTIVEFIGKREKERRLPLSTRLVEAIREASSSAAPNSPLFAGKDGIQLSDARVYAIIRSLGEKAGVTQRISPHSLRHFAITDAAKVEDSVLKLQQFSGHSCVATLARYTHFKCDEIIQGIQRKRGML